MVKFLILFLVVGGVVFYFLRKRNIRIGLSPTGQNFLMMALERFFQMILRRFGL
ncbi:MAG: hypothetical protein G8237_01265 [Magnetococcales bacterium]|nr:hypothetical protein [Magnetococcales bacterium]NGZ04966.1 hypothetical protein [Magnetococcales bacterium]